MRDQYKVLKEAYEKVTETSSSTPWWSAYTPTSLTFEEYKDIVNELLTATDYNTFIAKYKKYLDDRGVYILGDKNWNKFWDDPKYNVFIDSLTDAIAAASSLFRGSHTEMNVRVKDAKEKFRQFRKEYTTHVKAREQLYKDNPGINIDI